MPSGSAVQAWLDFSTAIHGYPLYTDLPGCSIAGSAANCSDVCSNSTLLLDPQTPGNLATCGSWATQLNAYLEDESFGGRPTYDRMPASQRFEALGLVRDEWPREDVLLLQATLVNCFADFFYASRSITIDLQTTPYVCSNYSMFGIGGGYGPVQNCFNALCMPRKLEPDLGGIGVYISLIIQSTIAILAAFVLCGLIYWPIKNLKKREKHIRAILMADIEFQKNQCYFAGAIQIASLVLSSHLYEPWFGPRRQQPDLMDAGFVLALSTNGFIPTIFTLVVITLRGRQSWYLLLLTVSIFVLSTGTLARLSHFWSNASVYKDPDHIRGRWSDICENYDIGSLSKAWCGRDFTDPSYLSIFRARGWLWTIWAICLCWLLYCVACKVLNTADSKQPKVRTETESYPFISVVRQARKKFGERIWSRLGMGLFALTWSLSFGYQFYVYSIVYSNGEVDATWTFGQIVSITIWAPCLVEYLNLELNGIFKGTEYKFPAPLRLTDDEPVQQVSERPLPPIPPSECRGSDAQSSDDKD